MNFKFPTFTIEGVKIPRVILGTNPLGWSSHFSRAKDLDWQKTFKNPEVVARLIIKSIDMGVNAIMGTAIDDVISGLGLPDMGPHRYGQWIKAVNIAQKETGEKLVCLATTDGPITDKLGIPNVKKSCEIIQAIGGQFMLLHGGTIASLLRFPQGKKGYIEGIEETINLIRDEGMIPGLGSHDARALTVSDEKEYGLSVYYTPYNKINYYMSPGFSRVTTFDAVKSAKKPVFAIKPFASGRLPIREALEFVFSMSGVQAVCVGIGSEEEMDETYRIAKEVIDSIPRLSKSE